MFFPPSLEWVLITPSSNSITWNYPFSMAAHNPPSFVLIDVRDGGAPRSLANAFVSPVRPDQGENGDLVARSVVKLGELLAANGFEALAALDRKQYAAVFMDCQMPEMDGYETTRRLRLREGTERHTHVIAVTAAAMAASQTA